MAGLRKLEYQDYMQSLAWTELREKALASAGYRCEKCGAEVREAHHIKYPKDFSMDTVENLQALCKACHLAETLDSKAKKLSEKLAKETDPGKIYLQLLAWTVEVAKCRG
jgi:5-methylcytosine-specific restriction endonuclease McrA